MSKMTSNYYKSRNDVTVWTLSKSKDKEEKKDENDSKLESQKPDRPKILFTISWAMS